MDCILCLSQAITTGMPVAMVTLVDAPGREGLVGRHLVVGPEGVLASEISGDPLEPELLQMAAQMIADGGAKALRAGGVRAYIEAFLPPPALLVIGAGHVAQPVAEIGKMIGFEVTVIDDRPNYANRERFPTADRILCSDFIPALQSVDPGPRHYAVLVTRGHRHDMDCLRELVHRPLAYIGMIGSRHRIGTVYRLLQEEDRIDPAHFARIYAPIGLDLGARSPAEIAVAVAAELVKVRRGGGGESLSRARKRPIGGR